MESGWSRRLLYLLFFFSGAAGLAYEAVWTRYLGLLVGHDAYAQVLVLVIFLGGLSVGAALIARRTEQIRNPLMVYAVVEAIVGLLALGFHDVFAWVAELSYTTIFPAAGDGMLGETVRWLVAGTLILPQAVLLGTTFPLMSAAVLRRNPHRAGSVLSWLYFSNSLGASLGVLIAGFVLLRVAGLPGTLAAAAVVNLLVALAAFMIARRSSDTVTAPSRGAAKLGVRTQYDAAPQVGAAADSHTVRRLLLGCAFGTAVASFAYEIDWIRMLSLVLGSATHSFELMLSAFILGLAIGAAIIHRLDRLKSPLVTLGWIQVAMGVFAILTLPVYVAAFDWTATLLNTFARTDAGYAGFTILRYGICLAVMLPATICAGMTLPLITRSLMASGDGEAAIGRVYAWNTLGSIIGVALAGLVLLPGLGLKTLLLSAGSLDVIIGVAVLALVAGIRRAAGAAIGAVAMIGVIALTVPLDRALLTSGVFRSAAVARPEGFQLLSYADGRTATVAVGEGPTGDRWISTNGKSDASLGAWWRTGCSETLPIRRLGGDEITQTLLPLVTHSFHPTATTAAVIGFGSGMSSHLLLGSSSLTEVTTIEIEPRMVDGARAFLPANHRVYDDPRSRIVLRDAKAHFATAGRTWDLILSEPSNPWVSGVSGLFTEEFYRRVAAALSPGGVFGQWLHTYELSDPLVVSVLAAIDRVFPDWQLMQVGVGDLLVVATTAPVRPRIQAAAVLNAPMLGQDLCHFVPVTPADIDALTLANASLLRPLLSQVQQPNSDYFPALDLGAERTRFMFASARGILSLGQDWFNLSRALEGNRRAVTVGTDLVFDGIGPVGAAWTRTALQDPESAESGLLKPENWVIQRWRDAHTSPPASWHAWIDLMKSAMQLRHGGLAGIIDGEFFDAAEAAARQYQAPPGVFALIAFRRGVQAWDATATLAAADRLLQVKAIGDLIGPTEVMEGAVVMALRVGDRETALRWFRLLAANSIRGTDDLRMMLLAAWLAPSSDS